MISYYKYTTGEAFTLNGDDYTGSFHILSGVAYTGQYPSVDTLELTPKDTFLSDIYVNELNLDTTYTINKGDSMAKGKFGSSKQRVSSNTNTNADTNNGGILGSGIFGHFGSIVQCDANDDSMFCTLSKFVSTIMMLLFLAVLA